MTVSNESFTRAATELGLLPRDKAEEKLRDAKSDTHIWRSLIDDGYLDNAQVKEIFRFIEERDGEEEPDQTGNELGGCKLLEKIGPGGMGTVYRARHLGLDRIVVGSVAELDAVENAVTSAGNAFLA